MNTKQRVSAQRGGHRRVDRGAPARGRGAPPAAGHAHRERAVATDGDAQPRKIFDAAASPDLTAGASADGPRSRARRTPSSLRRSPASRASWGRGPHRRAPTRPHAPAKARVFDACIRAELGIGPAATVGEGSRRRGLPIAGLERGARSARASRRGLRVGAARPAYMPCPDGAASRTTRRPATTRP